MDTPIYTVKLKKSPNDLLFYFILDHSDRVKKEVILYMFIGMKNENVARFALLFAKLSPRVY